MLGLAEMAARLAESRCDIEPGCDPHPIHNTFGQMRVVERAKVDEFLTPASCEYYRIIDRISRGEKP
jgi:hypothetical protein